jgi:hypothetical protein
LAPELVAIERRLVEIALDLARARIAAPTAFANSAIKVAFQKSTHAIRAQTEVRWFFGPP